MIDLTWKPKNYRDMMLIWQMDDRHLANSIAMIKRGHDFQGAVVSARTKFKLPALLAEQNYRNIRSYINPLWC